MPRGRSGRIVVEVDPELKGQLHATLALDGLTVKEWFVARASDYVRDRSVLAVTAAPGRAGKTRRTRRDGRK